MLNILLSTNLDLAPFILSRGFEFLNDFTSPVNLDAILLDFLSILEQNHLLPNSISTQILVFLLEFFSNLSEKQ